MTLLHDSTATSGAAQRAGRTPIVDLDRTIERGASALLALQAPEGFWWAELESNVTMTAEQLLFEYIMGVPDQRRWEQACRWILKFQQADGGWPIYYNGPSDMSVTVEAYTALKMAGMDPNGPQLTRARNWIRQNGGAVNARVFTKIWLAMLGEFDWDALPAMPPEVILLPDWSPLTVYEFGSWARATIVAILVLWAVKPVAPLPPGREVHEVFLKKSDSTRISFRRDRFPFTTRNFFLFADAALKLSAKQPWQPLRKKALAECERWIRAHQEADGSWGGIQPPYVYSLIALKALGHSNDDPAIRRGLDGMWESYGVTEDGTWRLQACLSPIWDTALAVTGLREAGVAADDPRLVRAGQWMVDHEVTTRSDWARKLPNVPAGGWAFEFENENYPDTDDTAEVLIALRLLKMDGSERPAMARATQWLRGLQSKNGGWGAYDKDNTKSFVCKIPFADFGAALDPPSEDVTAHVAEFLLLDGSTKQGDRAMARAIRYLEKTQEPDGSWFGRWGVNYVYGLGAVVPVLVSAGEDPQSDRIRRAVRWLEDHQNPDGGWGESCASYNDPAQRGIGTSTASQTAWALLALLAAGELEAKATERGIRYLIATQQRDGTWDEPEFTGTGFPGDFMINYHMYRQYWPLWALGRYRRMREGNEIHLPGTNPWQ